MCFQQTGWRFYPRDQMLFKERIAVMGRIPQERNPLEWNSLTFS
jgi:hypothetical protein